MSAQYSASALLTRHASYALYTHNQTGPAFSKPARPCRQTGTAHSRHLERHMEHDLHYVKLLTCGACVLCSLSALIDNRVFCVHGGLSPTISTLDQVGHCVNPMLARLFGEPFSELLTGCYAAMQRNCCVVIALGKQTSIRGFHGNASSASTPLMPHIIFQTAHRRLYPLS